MNLLRNRLCVNAGMIVVLVALFVLALASAFVAGTTAHQYEEIKGPKTEFKARIPDYVYAYREVRNGAQITFEVEKEDVEKLRQLAEQRGRALKVSVQ